MLLASDRGLEHVTLDAIGLALRRDDANGAIRLFAIHQYRAQDHVGAMEQALARYPELWDHELCEWMVYEIKKSGFVDIF
jgi:hypothetical protein